MMFALVSVLTLLFATVQASLTKYEDISLNVKFNSSELFKPVSISRDTIINRCQDWVNRGIPYSQTSYTGAQCCIYAFTIFYENLSEIDLLPICCLFILDGYRQDCSGMVSMAWQSSTAGGGHSTYNMQDICYAIDWSQIQRGDAILKPSQHVLIFDYWVNNDAFMQYAEVDYGQTACHKQGSKSYFAGDGYFPCRYNSVN